MTVKGMPSEVHPFTCGWNIAAAERFSFMGEMITENLTRGGRLAAYSDGELLRVLRRSIDREEQRLGFMALLPDGQFSDDNTQVIVARLRSLSATSSSGVIGDHLSIAGILLYGAGMFPPRRPCQTGHLSHFQ